MWDTYASGLLYLLVNTKAIMIGVEFKQLLKSLDFLEIMP